MSHVLERRGSNFAGPTEPTNPPTPDVPHVLHPPLP